MAWTSPMTFTNGAQLLAEQLNTHLRDNLTETMPAKATDAGSIFVATAANELAERIPTSDSVSTAETTTSTSYTSLTTVGPLVSVTTGTQAMCFYAAKMSNTTIDADCFASVGVSGATTVGTSDTRAIQHDASLSGTNRLGVPTMFTGLTPGVNIFTMRYRVSSGTGKFSTRRLTVVPL